MDIRLAWDARCRIAESPVWDAARRLVWFVDIAAGRILAFHADTGERRSWTPEDEGRPAIAASLGLCRSGRLVVALQRRVAVFDPETGQLAPLTAAFDEPDANRLNDGKVGPDGCFWVGSLDATAPHEPRGALYRVRPDGGVERRVEGVRVSNGLAWSPDGRTMYHSHSRGLFVDAYDFDPATGALSRGRRFANLSEAEGRPDGAACDAEGHYWSAGVSAGCLNRFSPEGRLVVKIPFAVPAPTMPCFGDGDLWVTSLREGQDEAILARYPALGGLFRLRAPVPGVPVSLFAD